MSHHDYQASKRISAVDFSFAALIMAAMRASNSDEGELLKNTFPKIYTEMKDRDEVPGGRLEME